MAFQPLYCCGPYHYFRRLIIPFALATSAVFVLGLWWFFPQQIRLPNNTVTTKSMASDSAVPEWVIDTSVPVSLLNNRAFFEWLAKQQDVPNHG